MSSALGGRQAKTLANIDEDLKHIKRESIPYFDKKIKGIRRQIAEAAKTRSVMMRRNKGVLPASLQAHNRYIAGLQKSLKTSVDGRKWLDAKAAELRKLRKAAAAKK
jgi:hypothetical protein